MQAFVRSSDGILEIHWKELKAISREISGAATMLVVDTLEIGNIDVIYTVYSSSVLSYTCFKTFGSNHVMTLCGWPKVLA